MWMNEPCHLSQETIHKGGNYKLEHEPVLCYFDGYGEHEEHYLTRNQFYSFWDSWCGEHKAHYLGNNLISCSCDGWYGEHEVHYRGKDQFSSCCDYYSGEQKGTLPGQEIVLQLCESWYGEHEEHPGQGSVLQLLWLLVLRAKGHITWPRNSPTAMWQLIWRARRTLHGQEQVLQLLWQLVWIEQGTLPGQAPVLQLLWQLIWRAQDTISPGRSSIPQRRRGNCQIGHFWKKQLYFHTFTILMTRDWRSGPFSLLSSLANEFLPFIYPPTNWNTLHFCLHGHNTENV